MKHSWTTFYKENVHGAIINFNQQFRFWHGSVGGNLTNRNGRMPNNFVNRNPQEPLDIQHFSCEDKELRLINMKHCNNTRLHLQAT